MFLAWLLLRLFKKRIIFFIFNRQLFNGVLVLQKIYIEGTRRVPLISLPPFSLLLSFVLVRYSCYN